MEGLITQRGLLREIQIDRGKRAPFYCMRSGANISYINLQSNILEYNEARKKKKTYAHAITNIKQNAIMQMNTQQTYTVTTPPLGSSRIPMMLEPTHDGNTSLYHGSSNHFPHQYHCC